MTTIIISVSSTNIIISTFMIDVITTIINIINITITSFITFIITIFIISCVVKIDLMKYFLMFNSISFYSFIKYSMICIYIFLKMPLALFKLSRMVFLGILVTVYFLIIVLLPKQTIPTKNKLTKQEKIQKWP